MLLACYGLMPRLALLRRDNHSQAIHFHVADNSSFNRQHFKRVIALVLFVALTAVSLLQYCVFAWLGMQSVPLIIFSTACLLISSSGVIAMLIPYATEIYPVHLRGSGAGIVAASSKIGGILGAGLGVTGFFNDIAFSAFFIALLLLSSGINTRGRRLEDIHAEFVSKSRR